MALRMWWFALVLLFAPTAVQAQAPERLLPAGTQIYLRWDGMEAHRAEFDKSALGKMLKDDAGKFLEALCDYGLEVFDKAVAQKEPKAAEMVNEVTAILSSVTKHGFVFGVEVLSVDPPEAQGVFVLPGSGGAKGRLLPLLEKISKLRKADVQREEVGKRVVHTVNIGPVHLAFWNEPDNDAVLLIGTQPPATFLKGVEKESFLGSATYKRLTAFKEFPTWARGHVDMPGLLKKVGEFAPAADQLIGELGLKELGGITMHSGFDGGAERSVIDVEMSGARKGLLALINKKTFTLKDLPPLPDDVTSFTASNFNLKNLYEGGLTVAESAVKVFAPGEGIEVREIVKQFEAIIGVKFGEDLFGSFGDMFVSYGSASEGPLGLGRTYLFKVTDEKKLRDVLEGLFKNIPPVPGVEVSFAKKAYRGGEIMQLSVKSDQGEFPLGAMTIHNGWFGLASYPQPLYGFILRSKGDLPVWKADDKLTKALTAFPKEFVGISVSDPRPGVEFLLSVAPGALSIANSAVPQFVPGVKAFDVSVIPHAKEATRHLFPNISVTTDDGKRIRMETRASLQLPF